MFGQEWRDLTFIHWSVDPSVVAPLMPTGTRPDTLDGRSYVALVPFHMRKAGLGARHPTPWLGDFAETNVRLYSVDDQGRHGVVFMSLESSRLIITLTTRLGYGLPYVWSKMRIGRRGTRMRYLSQRRWPDRGRRTAVTVDIGAPLDQPTELDTFLTARWGLHSTIAGPPESTPSSASPTPSNRQHLLP